MRCIRAILFLSLCAASAAPQAMAADAPDFEMMPAHIIRQINQNPTITIINDLPSGTQQGVISGARAWDRGQPIRVCFFEGNDALRSRIAKKAMEWSNKVDGVKLDFGDLNSPRFCDQAVSQIRIGFSDRGYWSHVGKDSITIPNQNQQSMNLSRFNSNPPGEPDFSRVVLHEFGHALGFQHEHQHPSGVCNTEFNWPFIYKYLSGHPNYWDQQTIDWNMRSRAYDDGDIVTTFNPSSIMLYTFERDFYVKGESSPCYHSLNSSLSPGDVAIAQLAYSTNQPQLRDSAVASIRSAALSLPAADRAMVERDIALYVSDYEGQKKILGAVDASKTDVDVFACKKSSDAVAMRDRVATYLSTIGGYGRVRVRGDAYLPGADGLTVVQDSGHAESADGSRVAKTLGSGLGETVVVAPNNSAKTPWLLTVIAC